MCGGELAKERIKVFEKTKLAGRRSIGARLVDGVSVTPEAVGNAEIRDVHSKRNPRTIGQIGH